MNRVDRLYALAEEPRAYSPRPRTARQLAARFEVSVRTIERDLNALLEAGLPIRSMPGPGGGYAVDKARTLPPVNFTAAEATALAIALSGPGASPLAEAPRSAVRKVVAAMPAAEAEAARRLAGRVRLHAGDDAEEDRAAARVVEEGVVRTMVVEIGYADRVGNVTHRQAELLALLVWDRARYLVGHCHLRDDRRAFRLDRVREARLTGEPAPEPGEPSLDGLPASLRPLALPE